MTSWSKSVTIYTLRNWRPPLNFRRNWGPKGRKNFLETAPSCLRVWMTPSPPPRPPPYLKVWIRHCLHPILSGEPHPENLNWHVVCLLTSFQGETSTFTWLFIAVEQTGLRLFAIPNQCATPVHECWLRTAFIESPTAQAVIREEPFDYQVFVEMRHLLEVTQTTMDRLRNWTRPKGLEHAEG